MTRDLVVLSKVQCGSALRSRDTRSAYGKPYLCVRHNDEWQSRSTAPHARSPEVAILLHMHTVYQLDEIRANTLNDINEYR